MKLDSEIIQFLGGASKVAELLGFNKKTGGVQRVHNWLRRGIPARMKLNFPQYFQHPHDNKIESKK